MVINPTKVSNGEKFMLPPQIQILLLTIGIAPSFSMVKLKAIFSQSNIK